MCVCGRVSEQTGDGLLNRTLGAVYFLKFLKAFVSKFELSLPVCSSDRERGCYPPEIEFSEKKKKKIRQVQQISHEEEKMRNVNVKRGTATSMLDLQICVVAATSLV